MEDHPRGCGEKDSDGWPTGESVGSSPRVRGKAQSRQGLRPGRGIIPAGAGKREAEAEVVRLCGDHPRGCGEKPRHKGAAHPRRGSSPRVRGKAGGEEEARRVVGIIPAGAGKRETTPTNGTSRWDHPRGCGEKRHQWPCTPFVAGSSPRVRGKGRKRFGSRRNRRIIPAGAGKRAPHTGRGRRGEDHPRGCGEK